MTLGLSASRRQAGLTQVRFRIKSYCPHFSLLSYSTGGGEKNEAQRKHPRLKPYGMLDNLEKETYRWALFLARNIFSMSAVIEILQGADSTRPASPAGTQLAGGVLRVLSIRCHRFRGGGRESETDAATVQRWPKEPAQLSPHPSRLDQPDTLQRNDELGRKVR